MKQKSFEKLSKIGTQCNDNRLSPHFNIKTQEISALLFCQIGFFGRTFLFPIWDRQYNYYTLPSAQEIIWHSTAVFFKFEAFIELVYDRANPPKESLLLGFNVILNCMVFINLK